MRPHRLDWHGVWGGGLLLLGWTCLGCDLGGAPSTPPTPPQVVAQPVGPEPAPPAPENPPAVSPPPSTVPPPPDLVPNPPPTEPKPLEPFPSEPKPAAAPGENPPLGLSPSALPAENPDGTPTNPLRLDAPKPFANWPKPAVALVLTGQMMGYIEPCGCTGLDRQKGGLARRHTLVKELREQRGWEVLPLDVGGQAHRIGKQAEIKFQRTADALRLMGYRAVAIGEEDLLLNVGELFAATNPDENPSIFTSANVALLDRAFQPTYQVISAGGKKIGVTAALGASYEKKITVADVQHAPPLEPLREAVVKLRAEKCDLIVLLAHASLEESGDFARQVEGIDLVVSSGGVGEPRMDLEPIADSKALLAQVGVKGMFAGVVGVFDAVEPAQRFRYQRLPLDAGYKDSPEIMTAFAEYQKQLERMGFAELGLRPQPHPSGAKFVGSEKCGDCHTKAFAHWSQTPHAHATDSLVTPPNSRSQIPRHFDPECLSCHATGWEPQRFSPLLSGYESLGKTPHLQHNGCENCHGPGSAHVEAETAGTDDKALARLREAMRLPLAGGVAERKCMECHDLDNSPDFHVKGAFETYWRQIEHKGKD